MLRTVREAGYEPEVGTNCSDGPHAEGMSWLSRIGAFGFTFSLTLCETDGDPVTRADMARIVRAALERPFPFDVPAEYSAGDAFVDDDDTDALDEDGINTLAQLGIVTGRGDRLFAPDEPLRRDQMATFLARTLAFALEKEVYEF